jgi:hypothetical protein
MTLLGEAEMLIVVNGMYSLSKSSGGIKDPAHSPQTLHGVARELRTWSDRCFPEASPGQ